MKSAASSLERLFLPRLNSIDGELKALNTSVDSVEKGMDSLRNELKAEIRSVATVQDVKIDGVEKSVDSLRNELKAEIRSVATAQGAKIDNVLLKVEEIHKELDMDRRMTIVEAKLKEFEKRS